MHGTWTAELATGLAVLDARLTRELRHEAGLVYHLAADRTHLQGGTSLFALSAETAQEHVWTVTEALLDTLDGLCDAGPTEAELAHDRETLREGLDDPDEVLGAAERAAVERLTGLPSGAGDAERVLAGLRPDAVTAAPREARASLVVGLPEGHRLHRLPELPVCLVPPVTGRVLARARFGSGEERGSCWGETGISVYPGRGDEALTVIAGEGTSIVLRARNWRGGEAAVAALRAAVPAELFHPAQPDPGAAR